MWQTGEHPRALPSWHKLGHMGEHPHARCRRGTCWEIRGFGHALAVCTTIRSRTSQGTFVSCGFCFSDLQFRVLHYLLHGTRTWRAHPHAAVSAHTALKAGPSRHRFRACSHAQGCTRILNFVCNCQFWALSYANCCTPSVTCFLSIMLLLSRVLVVCCSSCSSSRFSVSCFSLRSITWCKGRRATRHSSDASRRPRTGIRIRSMRRRLADDASEAVLRAMVFRVAKFRVGTLSFGASSAVSDP